MAIKLQVYKELRMVPVRFERAKTGDPDENYPDIDDRGHNFKVPAVDGLAQSTEIRGPVVGLLKHQKIKLRLVRECIGASAPLYLTSSDETAVKVITPAAGKKVASGADTIIELQGLDFIQARPKTAKIEVRHGSTTGPILYELTAYVFSPLPVYIQPHLVTINNRRGRHGIQPNINLDQVTRLAKALWAPCGVQLVVQATRIWSVNLHHSNIMRFDEINTVLAANWSPNRINVYIVREIADALGYGFSKSAHAGYGINRPSVFAGERQGTTARGPGDTYWWGNDLAHELGHFFTLWHPTDDPGDGSTWQRFETWSMRFLMHNFNFTHRDNPPGDPAHWPTFNDFGYGIHVPDYPFRAGLVPLKNVRTTAGAGVDGQCSTARNHILRGPAHLY